MATRSVARPQIKILIAAWGKAYIDRVDSLGLASFLAPGNLPAISRTHAVELVILTCAEDRDVFEALPSMAELRRHASIRYVPVDDLIAPGQYSTTLHLAFMRGIAAFGEQMTSMHFLFWNADFVLSDGALRHLAELVREDKKVVITGTLRCVAEQTDQMLLGRRDPQTHSLAIPSRQLVELAFRYPHPHHVAKTVNQSLCWSCMPSQMLWRIDADTQLGRFFKAFMFCLKPTRVVTTINGPCDYALVPELCPGEPQHMIQDSDHAFILEVQDRDAEREFIASTPRDEAERRACMGEWLTPEHLDTGRRVVLFRSGPGASPAAIREAEAGFQSYFDDFMQGVPAPSSHRGQYYWLFGVAAWNELRERHKPGQPMPPELDLPMPIEDLRSHTNDRHRARMRVAKGLSSIPARLREPLFGQPHNPRAFHPDTPSSALIEKTVADLRAGMPADGRILVAAEIGGWTDIVFPDSDPNVFRIEPTPAAFWPLSASVKASALLVYVRAPQSQNIPALLQRAAGALTGGAHVCVMWHDPGFKSEPDWVDEQLRLSLSAFGLLDEVEFQRHEAMGRDRIYAAKFYRAFEQRQPGLISRGAFYARLGALFAGRATQLGSREPSGRTLLATLTGRFTAGSRGTAAPHGSQPIPAARDEDQRPGSASPQLAPSSVIAAELARRHSS